MKYSHKAQGTIEYLVIIGIIVVIALLLVGLLTGFLSPAQGISQTTSKLQAQTSGLLAITTTSENTDGNYLIRIQSNDPDNITITNVKIGDTNQNYTQTLPQGSAQNFEIDTTGICTTGTTTTQNITITYTTQYGITKTTILENVIFPCENYSVNTVATPTTEEEEEETDTTPPTITLQAPEDNNTVTTADTNTNFIFTANETTTDCNLYIETSGTWYLADVNNQSIAADINKIIDANIAAYGEGDHYWDINCTDTTGNKGTATDRNINYIAPTPEGDTTPPVIFLLSPANYDTNTNATITFDFNAIDDINTSIGDCSLYLDGVDVNSNPTFRDANNGYFNYTFTPLEDHIYDWNVTCSDGTNTGSADTNRKINLNRSSTQITTCAELATLNCTTSTKITEDINCYTATATASADEWGGNLWNAGAGWAPLCNLVGSMGGFEGTLDGNGHTIYGLHINRPSTIDVGIGFFEWMYNDHTVSKLAFKDANFTGSCVIGGLSGLAYHWTGDTTGVSDIDQVHFDGNINQVGNGSTCLWNAALADLRAGSGVGAYGIGGLIGVIRTYNTTINDSYFSGTITTKSSKEVGGIAGSVVGYSGVDDVIITNAFSEGTIDSNAGYQTGGIAGLCGSGSAYGTLNYVFSITDVNGAAANNSGMIVGVNTSAACTVTNAYWYDSPNDLASTCMATDGGHACESNNEALSYFKGDVDASSPFTNFNFSTIWEEVDGDTPKFQWEAD